MELTDSLREGRRKLAGIPGYELLEDLIWEGSIQKWIFKFRLIGIYKFTETVPLITVWYCHVSNLYPLGEIEIYPDAKEGIINTFPHMTYNKDIGELWRSGNICVKTSNGIWGKVFYNQEPYEKSKRLYWHILRSQSWIKAAAEDKLFSNNDPFEFPTFPKISPPVCTFNETKETFTKWSEAQVNNGIVRWKKPDFNRNLANITAFECNGQVIMKYDWGKSITDAKGIEGIGLWYRLPKMPVKYPYEIPKTWRHLFDLCNTFNPEFYSTLEWFLGDKQQLGKLTYIMFGFPISEVVGGHNSRIHWFVAEFPKPVPINGFRVGPAHNKAQMKKMFSENSQIKWIQSENWAKDQITSRGNILSTIQKMNIAVVGAGALGSLCCELLIRLGCERLTIVDDDESLVGNFSRHTLTMESLPDYKSKQLAKRLNMIFPYVEVSNENQTFEKCILKNPSYLSNFSMVIDVTGNDRAFIAIENAIKETSNIFVSISTSFEAKRLYCFCAKSTTNELFELFQKELQPWFKKQKDENPNPVFPLEGLGCWHPIFPARIDDIYGIMAPVIRLIENFVQSNKDYELNVVQRSDNDGVQIIKS